MKRWFRISFGLLFMILGIGLVIVSGLYVLKGQFSWSIILVTGLAISFAGFGLLAGNRLRDIIEDLFLTLP